MVWCYLRENAGTYYIVRHTYLAYGAHIFTVLCAAAIVLIDVYPSSGKPKTKP